MKEKTKIGFALTFCLLLCFIIQYFSSHLFDIIIFGLSFLAVLEFKKLLLKSGMPTFDYCPEIACFLVFVALFTGVFAVKFMLKIVEKNSLIWFAIYLVVISLISIFI